MSWKIQAGLKCGPGRIHTENEDAYYFDGSFSALQEMNQTVSLSAGKSGPGSLWAVCDGMGGQGSGEIASSMAVHGLRSLSTVLAGHHDFEAVLRSWVRQAGSAVLSRTRGGGCTLALVYADGDTLRAAHVGDSRVYRLHQDHLACLTRDHTQVEMLLSAGMITPEQAAVHPQRHVLTRWIGMDGDIPCSPALAEPFPAVPGDRLLLCSDGITDVLEDSALLSILLHGGPEACAAALYNAAMEHGGPDNITAMVLDIEG